MAHAALLGRDFMSRPEMKKLVIKALRLEEDSKNKLTNELMAINYLESP